LALPAAFAPHSLLALQTWPTPLYFGVLALFLGALVFAQVYRYRHISTSAQRQQTKWIILGIALVALGYLGRKLILLALEDTPPFSPQAALGDLIARTLVYVALPLIPITIAVAMLRHHLFDVDLLLRSTLIYAALVATLAVLYEAGTLGVIKGLLAITGQESFPFEVAIAFAVGVLAGPLHHRIERGITRVFYPRKYAAERRIHTMSKQLRREWGVAPRYEEWTVAGERRLAEAWAAVRHRGAGGRVGSGREVYVQERLFR